jgi:hypothetical protein
VAIQVSWHWAEAIAGKSAAKVSVDKARDLMAWLLDKLCDTLGDGQGVSPSRSRVAGIVAGKAEVVKEF